MKNIVKILVVLLVILLVIQINYVFATSVTSIKLNYTSYDLEIGLNVTLIATVSPSTASNRTVTWKSGNTDVATVNSSGKVIAKSVGTAIILASVDSGLSTTCKIRVLAVEVSSIKIGKNFDLELGKAKKLTATILPSNATNKKVTWTSSDTKVATIDSTGTVKAIYPGESIISAKSSNGIIDKCRVIVYETKVTSIKIGDNFNLAPGKKKKLTAIISPSNATNKKIKWTSSDTKVATIDSSGNVTAIKNGEATLTAQISNSNGVVKGNCKITVKIVSVNSIEIKLANIAIEPSKSKTIKVTFNPIDATNQSIKWSSSNNNIAKVSSLGLVKAIKTGTAIITATSSNGKIATCKVVVVSKNTAFLNIASNCYYFIRRNSFKYDKNWLKSTTDYGEGENKRK